MTQKLLDCYTKILREEMIVAMGCTEPIAVAYAGAVAAHTLGKLPQRLTVQCSGNIIKNANGVIVPNSNGRRGIEIAALLGACGGDPYNGLSVLAKIKPEHIEQAVRLKEEKACRVSLLDSGESAENLHIILTAEADGDEAAVELVAEHTNIVRVEKNGQSLLEKAKEEKITAQHTGADLSVLNVKDIIRYAESVDVNEIAPILERQKECNLAISEEGLQESYGARVGKSVQELFGTSCFEMRAIAAAAAASDARMNGCSMPVVINSGSGNQGITLSIPVVMYAQENHLGEEKMLRALAMANLLNIHQKRYIGRLSAYCGAVSAACSSGAAICWMAGGDDVQIGNVIINTLGTVGGILCDGAKSSCAGKISASLYCALLSVKMGLQGRVYQPGEGLVMQNLEQTIANIGYVAKNGMRCADREILKLMIEGSAS